MRAILVALIVISFLLPVSSYAETLERRVNLFKDVAEALESAGDAIKSITDGVAHMVKTGASGYISYV